MIYRKSDITNYLLVRNQKSKFKIQKLEIRNQIYQISKIKYSKIRNQKSNISNQQSEIKNQISPVDRVLH